MQSGQILSVGLLSVLMFGCEEATRPEQSREPGRYMVPAVNAVSKSAALKAGFGMSREVADTSTDFSAMFKNEQFQQQMRDIGICENFIQLVVELGTTKAGQSMESPRFEKVVTCLVNETKTLGSAASEKSGEAWFPLFDKCLCDGSGTVFGAIRAYAVAGYSAPRFNGYSAPVAAPGYSSPSVAPGYGSPSPAPGYSAPSL